MLRTKIKQDNTSRRYFLFTNNPERKGRSSNLHLTTEKFCGTDSRGFGRQFTEGHQTHTHKYTRGHYPERSLGADRRRRVGSLTFVIVSHGLLSTKTVQRQTADYEMLTVIPREKQIVQPRATERRRRAVGQEHWDLKRYKTFRCTPAPPRTCPPLPTHPPPHPPYRPPPSHSGKRMKVHFTVSTEPNV